MAGTRLEDRLMKVVSVYGAEDSNNNNWWILMCVSVC